MQFWNAGKRLLRKSMEVANWLKASTDAALSVEPSTKQVSYSCTLQAFRALQAVA